MDYFNQESERLIYRKVEGSDYEAWLPFFEDNSGLPYLGIDLQLSKETLAKDWIDAQLKRYKTDGFGHLAVIEKKSNRLIGMGGIIKRQLEGKEELEVAYSLKPKFWGKGYGTELATTMKNFGFQSKLSNRLISIIHKDNKPSIRVALKNGMQPLFETIYMGMDVFVYGIEKK